MAVIWKPSQPPRPFTVGRGSEVLTDVGRMCLAPNEQVTFVRDSGAEYDVVAKDWGFYATPSVNGRLAALGYRTAVARSLASGRRYVLLVERTRQEDFAAYLAREGMVVDVWLDEADVGIP